MTVTYAHGKMDEPFWPIGLCIAWVQEREKSKAAMLFARRLVFGEARPSKEWAEARTTLLRALAEGRVSALGLPAQKGQRVAIPALAWIDLRIEQRGLFDEARDLGLMITYRDVRIAAESMRQEWPADTTAASLRSANGKPASIPGLQGNDLRIEQRGTNDEGSGDVGSIADRQVKIGASSMLKDHPAETAAAKRAREKLDGERACLESLKQRMTEKSNEPVAKKTLRQEFPDISERALDRCFTLAARETGAVAWSEAGRRRRQRSDSAESSGAARTES